MLSFLESRPPYLKPAFSSSAMRETIEVDGEDGQTRTVPVLSLSEDNTGVHYGPVMVDMFSVELGTDTTVPSDGPPICLASSRPTKQLIYSNLDDYEETSSKLEQQQHEQQTKSHRQRMQEFRMDANSRTQLLLAHGHSQEEIEKATQKSNVSRYLRKMSRRDVVSFDNDDNDHQNHTRRRGNRNNIFAMVAGSTKQALKKWTATTHHHRGCSSSHDDDDDKGLEKMPISSSGGGGGPFHFERMIANRIMVRIQRQQVAPTA